MGDKSSIVFGHEIKAGRRMAKLQSEPLISMDMLRAFDSLARTLNLTETAEKLGITRQTVRRQISHLETIKGGDLFRLTKHSYTLTSLGASSLAGARSILRQGEAWSNGFVSDTGGSQHLEYAKSVDADGNTNISQQHPISAVARFGGPIIKKTLAAWGEASAQIETAQMLDVRPYLVLFRRGVDGWIFVEVGEKSAYAKWFGWTWAKSSVGHLLEDDNAGDDFNRVIAGAYERIYGEGGVRLDHLFASLPREKSKKKVPVTFQRLLMGCEFPDGSPALAMLAIITRDVEIFGMPKEHFCRVTDDLISEFDGQT